MAAMLGGAHGSRSGGRLRNQPICKRPRPLMPLDVTRAAGSPGLWGSGLISHDKPGREQHRQEVEGAGSRRKQDWGTHHERKQTQQARGGNDEDDTTTASRKLFWRTQSALLPGNFLARVGQHYD
eukprot:36818-Pyramimonas_sp.AAC.1